MEEEIIINEVNPECGSTLLQLPESQTQWVFHTDIADYETSCHRGMFLTVEVPQKGRGVFLFPEKVTSDSHGARSRLVEMVPPGETLWVAQPAGVVVTERYRERICHCCFRRNTGKAFRCGACVDAVYCSRTCLADHAPAHDPVCAALAELRLANRGGGGGGGGGGPRVPPGESDRVRLALDVLRRRQPAVPTGEEEGGGGAGLRRRRPAPEPVAHWGSAGAAAAARGAAAGCAAAAAARLGPRLGFALPRRGRALAELLLQIRFNAHPLEVGGLPGAALGLFPTAALLNHSCAPSVFPTAKVVGNDIHLEIRSLRPILPGSEICCSYIDELCSPRQDRQLLLQHAFLFDCKCKRCRSTSPEYPSDILVCHKCGLELENNTLCANKQCLTHKYKTKPPTGEIEALEAKMNSCSGEEAGQSMAAKVLDGSTQVAAWLHPAHRIRHAAALLVLGPARAAAAAASASPGGGAAGDPRPALAAARTLVACWEAALAAPTAAAAAAAPCRVACPQLGALHFMIAKICIDGIKNAALNPRRSQQAQQAQRKRIADMTDEEEKQTGTTVDMLYDTCSEALEQAGYIFGICYGQNHEQTQKVEKLNFMFSSSSSASTNRFFV